ncbi:hypothetical protein DOY81_012510, partial [Sarcophaga bullata]
SRHFLTQIIDDNETNRKDDENKYAVTRESIRLFDILSGIGVFAAHDTFTTYAADNSSDNNVQEDRKTKDGMPENKRKSNSTVYLIKIVTLSFDFPFYGQLVRNVTVAPTGFIYTGENVHAYIASTQYIAPLMANFDTRLSNDSFVRLNDTGSSFIVLWENVYLPDQQDVGKFTFSTTLHKNGDIVFIFIDHDLIVYEYHRVSFLKTNITNSTIITLKALPTCLEYTDCVSCINHVTAFNCSWCSTVNRCSSCLDRQKQNWIDHDCDDHNVTEEDLCPASVSETPLITSSTTNSTDDSGEKEKEPFDTEPMMNPVSTSM